MWSSLLPPDPACSLTQMPTVELKGLDPIFISFPFAANARSGLPTKLANEREVGKEVGGWGAERGGMGDGGVGAGGDGKIQKTKC